MFFGVVLAGVLGLEDTGEAIAVPLLATQILWINLLTDGAPALALGMDAPPDDVMRRPPRRLTDRVIDAEMWVGIVWVGAVMAVGDAARARPPPPGRDRRRLRERRRGADDGVHDAGVRAALQLLQRALRPHERLPPAVHEPAGSGARSRSRPCSRSRSCSCRFLNDAFDTTPLGLEEWLICVGLASVVLWADEAKKLLERRLRHAEQRRALTRAGVTPSGAAPSEKPRESSDGRSTRRRTTRRLRRAQSYALRNAHRLERCTARLLRPLELKSDAGSASRRIYPLDPCGSQLKQEGMEERPGKEPRENWESANVHDLALLCAHGALAQLGERRLCKPEVTGSIPVRSIGIHAGSRRFGDTRLARKRHKRFVALPIAVTLSA